MLCQERGLFDFSRCEGSDPKEKVFLAGVLYTLENLFTLFELKEDMIRGAVHDYRTSN